MYNIHACNLNVKCTPFSRAGQRPVGVLSRPVPTCGIQSPTRVVRCTTAASEAGPGANKEPSSSREAMDTAAAALVGFTMVAPATMAGATMAEAIMAAEDANAAEKETASALQWICVWAAVAAAVCFLGKVSLAERRCLVFVYQMAKEVKTIMEWRRLAALARIVGRTVGRIAAWCGSLLAAVLAVLGL